MRKGYITAQITKQGLIITHQEDNIALRKQKWQEKPNIIFRLSLKGRLFLQTFCIILMSPNSGIIGSYRWEDYHGYTIVRAFSFEAPLPNIFLL